jgi:hypothetical protein
MKTATVMRNILAALALSAALISQAGGSPGAPQAMGETSGGSGAPVGTSGPLSPAEQARERTLAQLVLDAPKGKPSAGTLRRNGFVQVSTDPSTELVATTSNDVTMNTPRVYWDTTYNRYTATASYGWKNDNFGCCGNVGGYDGFALRSNRAIGNTTGVTGRFSGKPGLAYGTTIVSNPSDNNVYGAAYRWQDTSRALAGGRIDYNMYSGVVTLSVNPPGCGTTAYLYSNYAHSWSSSSLNGFEISASGFGVSWSTSSNHWTAASQAGSWKPC